VGRRRKGSNQFNPLLAHKSRFAIDSRLALSLFLTTNRISSSSHITRSDRTTESTICDFLTGSSQPESSLNLANQ
jgi:hypothetical protein